MPRSMPYRDGKGNGVRADDSILVATNYETDLHIIFTANSAKGDLATTRTAMNTRAKRDASQHTRLGNKKEGKKKGNVKRQ